MEDSGVELILNKEFFQIVIIDSGLKLKNNCKVSVCEERSATVSLIFDSLSHFVARTAGRWLPPTSHTIIFTEARWA